MEKEECKECEKQWSCRYLTNNFMTKDKKCGYNKGNVEIIHRHLLRDREEMLKVTNNYGRDM